MLRAVPEALPERGHVPRPAHRVDQHPHRRHLPGELHQPGRRLPRAPADLGDEVPGLLPPVRLARRVLPRGRDGARRRRPGLRTCSRAAVSSARARVRSSAPGSYAGGRASCVDGPVRVRPPSWASRTAVSYAVDLLRPGRGDRGGVLVEADRDPGAGLGVAQHRVVGAHRIGGRAEGGSGIVVPARLDVDDGPEHVPGRADPLAGVDRADPGGGAAEPLGDDAAAGDQDVEVDRVAGHQLGDGGARVQASHRGTAVITTPLWIAVAGSTAGCGPAGSSTMP